MKKITQLTLSVSSALLIVGCSTTPTAKNYSEYMNQPNVKNGEVQNADNKALNKPAWNDLKISNATSVRRDLDGNYANNPNKGYLFVRANIVNEGTTPVQAKWRCKFYDSNNITLEDEQNDENAKSATGLGWHTMVAYPVTAKSHVNEANLVHCVAPTPLATEFRVEVHDTANDITTYNN